MSRNHWREKIRAQAQRPVSVAATVPPPDVRRGVALEAAVCAAFFLLIGLAFSQAIQIQFSLPKLIWLRFGAAALALLWAARAWAGAVKRVPSSILVATLMLVAWWTLTTPFAVSPSTALHGMRGRYNGLINQTILIGIFLAFASAAAPRRALRGLVTLFVLSLVPIALYAIAQNAGLDPFVWPNPRPGSTIGHPVPLAAILSLAIPFAIAFLLTETRRVLWWSWAAVVAIFLLATAVTLSRGPWVGLFVAVAIVIVVSIRRHLIKRAVLWAAAVGLIVTVALAWNSTSISRVSLRLTQIPRLWSDPSFAGRFVYYDAAYRMAKDHPVVGVGLENYGLLYPRYRPIEGETIPADAIPTMVHNGYLQAATTTGVPGLVLYVALVTAIMIVLIRSAGRENADGLRAAARERDGMLSVAFIGALAGYLVQDLSGWQELSLSVYFWTIAGVAVAYATPEPQPQPRAVSDARGRWRIAAVAGAGLVCMLMLTLGLQSLRAMQVDRAFFESHLLDPVRDWRWIQENLATGLRLAANDPYYQDSAGVLYLKRFHATGDRDAYNRALELFERARHQNVYDPYILLHRIDLEAVAVQRKLVQSSSADVGRVVAAALEMDSNNATVHETVARLRFADRRLPEALESIRRAVALRPSQPRYHALHGDVLRALGDLAQASEAYRKEASLRVQGTADWRTATHKLMVTLAELGRYDAVVTEGQSVVSVSEDDLAFTLIGIAQQSMNRPSLAREAFTQALRINPGNVNARRALDGVTVDRIP